MKKILQKLFMKLYRVEYKTHSKRYRVAVVGVWCWQKFSQYEFLMQLCEMKKLKPSQVQIINVTRIK